MCFFLVSVRMKIDPFTNYRAVNEVKVATGVRTARIDPYAAVRLIVARSSPCAMFGSLGLRLSHR